MLSICAGANSVKQLLCRQRDAAADPPDRPRHHDRAHSHAVVLTLGTLRVEVIERVAALVGSATSVGARAPLTPGQTIVITADWLTFPHPAPRTRYGLAYTARTLQPPAPEDGRAVFAGDVSSLASDSGAGGGRLQI